MHFRGLIGSFEFYFYLFFFFLPSPPSEERRIFEKGLTGVLLQQQQYPGPLVFFGNNYTLLTSNKLEGGIVDLLVNATVDSPTEGRGCY